MVMMVISDISERVHRFEAEKLAITEQTSRKKDAEANRFTKHEVKNGLLSAIGLCESIGTSPSSNQMQVENEPDRKLVAELDVALHEMLNTVMTEATARDIVHEVYEPTLEIIDLPTILNDKTRICSGCSSIKELTTPFPQFLMDPQLLKQVHQNAVLNACKFGKRGGEVLTELEYDEDRKEYLMRVINRPGPGHEELVKLSPAEVETVFCPEKSLHSVLPKSNDGNLVDCHSLTRSAGDGAWIMKKCAKLLDGDCHIKFEEDRTVLTFRCPAVPYKKDELPTTADIEPIFTIPKGTWGIGIDDSRIQRKLLVRLFAFLGIDSDHRRVLGEDASEILNFSSFVKQLAHDHPDEKIFIIADENLDIEGSETISGSLSTQELLKDLGPDEKRVLALVRSANDSKDDVDLYKVRTHGFFPKVPLQKDKVQNHIMPYWTKRFPDSADEGPVASAVATVVAESARKLSDEGQTFVIMRMVEMIDDLLQECSSDSKLQMKWPAVWEKLHLLKGDILVVFGSQRASTIADAITKLRGAEAPADLLDRWTLVRSLVVSLL